MGLQPFAGAIGGAVVHRHNAGKIHLVKVQAGDELLGVVQLVVAGEGDGVVAVHVVSIVWFTFNVKWATQHFCKACQQRGFVAVSAQTVFSSLHERLELFQGL